MDEADSKFILVVRRKNIGSRPHIQALKIEDTAFNTFQDFILGEDRWKGQYKINRYLQV
jgi:hypothetical protein